MIGSHAHQEGDLGRFVILERVGHGGKRVIPGKSVSAQFGGTILLDGIRHAVGIVESLQSDLSAGAGLAEVDGMRLVALDFDRPPLHRADDESAGRRALAAGGGIKSALAVVGVLRHFEVGLARHKFGRRAATRQHSGSGRAEASQFQKIAPGNLVGHAVIL